MQVPNLRTIRGFIIAYAILIFFGHGNAFAQANIVQQCDLADFDSVGAFHAIYIWSLPGQTDRKYVFAPNGGQLTIFSDGTAQITGRVINASNSNQQWDVDFWLINQLDFAAWSGLGRNVKIELAPQAVVAANQQDWLFWEMDSTRSRLTGVPGTFFAGDTLLTSHDPPNRQYGFQYGIGANAKNGNLGISGWFKFSGSFTGHGDINANAECGNVCDLQVTEALPRCSSDSTFDIRLNIQGSGTSYEVRDGLGNTLLANLSAGIYFVGPFAQGSTVDLTVLDTSLVGCDTSIYMLTTDCTPIQVCDLRDFDTVGAFHAVYLFSLPGQSNPRYIFDQNGGKLTTFGDGTALITGRVINVGNPNLQWDIMYWLEQERDFAAWSALGRDVKIEQAPPAVVAANQQDWIFWEVDSLRSIMTGVPGTNFDGDTLFISHDPPDREFGFQFGQGANAKNGGFGLSGWFRFTGAYTDHGDINVLAECGSGRACDLLVTQAQAQCLTDSTYEIEVTFTGTGNGYQILDNQGNVLLAGIGAGTYFLGPFVSGSVVDIRIVDTTLVGCDTLLVGLTEDCTPVIPPCDLSVISTNVNCINNSQFEISITIAGSGNYILGDNQGSLLQTGGAGTYIFGPYASNTLVNISVNDSIDFDCDSTVVGLTQDCTPPCDLLVDSAGVVCVNNDSFVVNVLFSGSGNGFVLTDDQGSPSQSGAAGNYTFGPYSNNTQVSINIVDTNGVNCDTTIVGLTQDCTPPCDLQLISAVPTCISSTQFEVTVNFSGTGNGFVLTDNQGSAIQSGSAGTYTFGPYNSNTQVSISIVDTNGTNCDTTVMGLTQDCTPPCDLLVDSAGTVCVSNDSFVVNVLFSGSGNGFVLTDDQGSPSQSGAAGNYTFGPYSNNTQVSISIVDTNGVNCDTTIVGLTQDCTPPCDLQLISAVPTCISSTQFEVTVNFSGTGNGFVLTDNQGSAIQSGSAGTYTFGPYNSNTQVSISIVDTNGTNCDTTVMGLTQDCTPPCDLLVDSAGTVCVSNDSFVVNVLFSGSGNGFVLTDDQGSPSQSGAAGNYTFGPYSNNTQVSISIVDTNGVNCDTTIVGLIQDCTPPCDLQLISAVPNCISSTQFEIVVNFSGTGNGFILTDNQGSPIQSGAAGTYTFGPYPSNTLVAISIVDINQANCDTTVMDLTQDCTPPCDLQLISAVPTCISSTQFEVTVNFSGTGNGFVLTDNQGSAIQSGSAGTYTFGPYNSNTQVSISIVDTNGVNCDTTVMGLTQDCTPPCDLLVDSAGTVCVSNDSFVVNVLFSGSGNGFVLTDDQGSPSQSGAAGNYTFGPYSNNTQVSINIVDTNGVNCDTTIVGLTQDCTPPCDLQLISAVPTCISSTQFEVTVNFSGTGNGFVLTDNQGSAFQSGSAGTYTFGPYNSNTQVSISITDTNGVNCDTTVMGLTQDCTPPCDLLVDSAGTVCVSNDSFVVNVLFSGSGNGFVLTDDQGSPSQSGAAGNYTFGPYSNNTQVSISIVDTNGVNCDTTIVGLIQDCTPPCDLQLISAVPNCISSTQFEIVVNFSGTGNGFILTDNQGSPIQSGAAGTYTFGPYPSNTLVAISIVDINQANCDTTVMDLTQDCTPPCDLQLISAVPTCISSTQFEVTVNFSGTGNGFVLTDNQGSAIQSGSAGTYTFGPYNSNTQVSISIVDTNGVNCDTTVMGLTQDCTPPCDLLVDSAGTVCVSNDSFVVNVLFSGSGNGFVLTDDQGSPSQSGAAGNYTFGPYSNNTQVSINIVDTNGVNCDTTIVGLTQDCTPPCDLQLISAVPTCISSTQFEVTVNFSGTGNGFVLTDNQGSAFQSGSAGTYTFGPYNSNTQVSISITDTNGVNCDTTVMGLTQDCTPPCDLLVDSAGTVCVSNDSFVVNVLFSGSGNGFVLTDDQGSPSQSGAAGNYTFGPYSNNTQVSISITDTNGVNCDTTLVGLTQDCTPPCVIQVNSPIITCLPSGEFEIEISFTGNGSGYTLVDDQGVSSFTGAAGTYTFGPYPSNTLVNITITDTSLANCFFSLTNLTSSCLQPCSLQVGSAVANCIGNTRQFEIDVDFTGSGTNYSLVDNQGNPVQTGAPGLYTFGPYTSGTMVDISIVDLDTTSVGCDTLLTGITTTCTPVCDFNVDTIFSSCISPDSFVIRLVLQGIGNDYQITDNLGNILTGVVPSATDTITIGQYFNSTDVFVSITDTNLVGCDTLIGPITADCTPVNPCVLTLDSVVTVCAGSDSFCVKVTFSGPPSNYRISDNLFQNFILTDTAGTYMVGCYPNNTPIVIEVTDLDLFACSAMSGIVTLDCTNPPENNECTDAEMISCNTIVNGSTSKATPGNFSSSCNNVNVNGHPGVWYRIVGNGNLITLNTCATFPFRNTAITVFKGDCGTLRCVTANDETNSCPGGPSEVTFLSDPNVDYFIFVSTPPGSEGNFVLRVSCNNSKRLVPKLTAKDAKTNIKLSWSVEQEVDVEGYNIERSLDGLTFEWIDFEVAKEGNSNTTRMYEYEDYSAEFNKTYYYRVEQLLTDGRTIHSQIASASIYTDKDMYLGNLYPNPARTAFKVDLFANEDGDINLYLMDESGRVLQTLKREVRQGNNILEVDVSWLISGVYYVNFTYKGQRESRKLVLIR